jgi:alpha-glucuronidase
LKSGQTLWNALCYHYFKVVDSVVEVQKTWDSLKGKIDEEEFNSELMLLKLQYENAVKWRDGCVLYFQTFSKQPVPAGLPEPEYDL